VEPTDVVVVNGLHKRYKQLDALKGIDVRVHEGEIFGLLGPNGAGKTTLIKTLVGSTRPDAGDVRVLGLDPRTQARTLRRQIGYMPQAPALYEDLSPQQNLQFFGRAHGVQDLDRRVEDVLALTGLRARARDPVYTFSGGMKQRVSLACALLHQPRVLLLDEPTAGVDPKLRGVFWEHFRALAARGATLVISTHQMDEALLCDRLTILRDGMVLASDAPQRLLERGHTRIRIWRGEKPQERVDEAMLADYPAQLPQLLQRYHLDPAVTRIEVERDTLDTIVLAMIDNVERRAQSAPSDPRAIGG
jgi:ABC-2 type transport system ATP-binding protein